MENASKALIIAGAILLSILIIGLGMAVYNNATSSTQNANLDSQELQAHNSQFLSYEGRQKGSNVKVLINMIKKNNMTYQDRMIQITNRATQTGKVASIPTVTASQATDPNASAYTTILSAIKNSTTYYVTFANSDNGCIGGVEFHIYSDADLQ